MFFFFICGTQDFNSMLHGYEDTRVLCPWGHIAIPIKKRKFFTLCFIPLIPVGSSEELRCTACQYRQYINKQELDNIMMYQQELLLSGAVPQEYAPKPLYK